MGKILLKIPNRVLRVMMGSKNFSRINVYLMDQVQEWIS